MLMMMMMAFAENILVVESKIVEVYIFVCSRYILSDGKLLSKSSISSLS